MAGMPPQAAVHKASEVKDDEPRPAASEVKDDEPGPAALEEGQGSGAITAVAVSHPAPVTTVSDGAHTASEMPAPTSMATPPPTTTRKHLLPPGASDPPLNSVSCREF